MDSTVDVSKSDCGVALMVPARHTAPVVPSAGICEEEWCGR